MYNYSGKDLYSAEKSRKRQNKTKKMIKYATIKCVAIDSINKARYLHLKIGKFTNDIDQ